MSIIDNDGYVKDPYRNFLAISRYAKWDDQKNRRETWSETVNRYMTFMRKYLQDKHGYHVDSKTIESIKNDILNMRVLPSMRSLMTSGAALEKSAIAAYNCAYLPIDSVKSFDEAMFILMCGTGVGFSVEQRYVSKLPTVPADLEDSEHVISVPDTREGWAKSLRVLISTLYAGQIPQFDFSRVRPAGERLKTFGGRASGPEPLRNLFMFVIDKFTKAKGRKLSSLECHDIICKVGEVVIAGSVRRSATISFSDLNDRDMAIAKNGQFWIDNAQRSMANNSAVYYGRPDVKTFLREWNLLIESGSGERGIFNVKAAQKQAAKYGLRDESITYGSNPCSFSGETLVMTTEGPRKIENLNNRPFYALVNGKPFFSPVGSYITGQKDLYKLKTKEGFEVTLTDNHEIMTASGEWVEARDLFVGQEVMIHNHREIGFWPGDGSFGQGYLIGALVGDGHITAQSDVNEHGVVQVWENNDIQSAQSMMDAMREYRQEFSHRTDFKFWRTYDNRLDATQKYTMSIHKDIYRPFGIYAGNKTTTVEVEQASSEFQAGYIRAIFDADGHVEGYTDADDYKGGSVRLGQSNYGSLVAIQRMLLRFGIKSRIYLSREKGKSLLPDGQGGEKFYDTKAAYRLVIGSDDLQYFNGRIGFHHVAKAEKLQKILSTRKQYSKPFIARVESFEHVRFDDVWDLSVSDKAAFDANGFYVHNSEIILRPYQFCNLSTVPVIGDETLEELKEKVKVATILGTWQSTIIHFHYIKKEWKSNTEEERLLGVSLSGIFGHPVLNGSEGLDKTEEWLKELRLHARSVNEELAPQIGIPVSAAITCVKPEGNSSQLTGTSSGIHPWYSEYYIRTVRSDTKDPLGQFMKDVGIPCEPDLMKPEASEVFSFPIKAPPGALTRKDITALEHLELWLAYQRHWCEHKPSITVNVKDEEWLEVGKWVFDHFDEISGISFLPYSDHVYKQAPYQEITKEQYDSAILKMPEAIEWSLLSFYENDDANVIGGRELACSAGACEVVDLSETLTSETQ